MQKSAIRAYTKSYLSELPVFLFAKSGNPSKKGL